MRPKILSGCVAGAGVGVCVVAGDDAGASLCGGVCVGIVAEAFSDRGAGWATGVVGFDAFLGVVDCEGELLVEVLVLLRPLG